MRARTLCTASLLGLVMALGACRGDKGETASTAQEQAVIRKVGGTFYLFGEFDIDGDGRTTADEGRRMRELVEASGGRLAAALDSSTDFVVLGAEPVLPPLTDDIRRNADEYYKWLQKAAAKERYDAVRQKAQYLSVPVLTQGQFLARIGHKDMARR